MSTPSRGTPQRARSSYRGGTPHRGTHTPRGGTPFNTSSTHTPSNGPWPSDIPAEPWGSVTESSILELIRLLEIEWDNSRPTLWAETARTVQGWSEDGNPSPEDRWHEGYDHRAGDRRLTRLRLMALIRDLTVALDRVCGVGTMVVHLHGELNPELRLEAITAEMMARNVSITLSDIIQGNSAFQDVVNNIMNLVRHRLAPMFGRDWRQRAVGSRYIDPWRMRIDPVDQDVPLPARTLSPNPSPPRTPSPPSPPFLPSRRSPRSYSSRVPSPETPLASISLPENGKGKGKSSVKSASSATLHSSIGDPRPSSVLSFLSGLSSAASSISLDSVPSDMSPPSSPLSTNASAIPVPPAHQMAGLSSSSTAPLQSEPEQDVFSSYGYTDLPVDVIDLLQAVRAPEVIIARVEEIYNYVGRARQLFSYSVGGSYFARPPLVCNFSYCYAPPCMTIGSTSSSCPCQRAKVAPKSDEQKAAQKQTKFEANKAYYDALTSAIEKVMELVNSVAVAHQKSYDRVASDLSLTMKEFSEHRTPNIYNAYNFCWARVVRGDWDNDPSRKDVINIIKEGEVGGGHECLSEGQREILLQVLQADHQERDTSIVRKPMKQLHDIRTSLEKIKRELNSVYTRSRLEYILLTSRSSSSQLSAPSIYTSAQGADFMLQVLRIASAEAGMRFEAFAIGSAGIQDKKYLVPLLQRDSLPVTAGRSNQVPFSTNSRKIRQEGRNEDARSRHLAQPDGYTPFLHCHLFTHVPSRTPYWEARFSCRVHALVYKNDPPATHQYAQMAPQGMASLSLRDQDQQGDVDPLSSPVQWNMLPLPHLGRRNGHSKGNSWWRVSHAGRGSRTSLSFSTLYFKLNVGSGTHFILQSCSFRLPPFSLPLAFLPITFDPGPVTFDPDPVAANPYPAAVNPDPAAVNPDPATVDPDPAAIDPDPTIVAPDSTTIVNPDRTIVKPSPVNSYSTHSPGFDGVGLTAISAGGVDGQ
ncbi:hypothetical protein OF83DRAFT_1089035 [Amylostereum chailletii]|nr:hypothetical protein OF83DRAFT_1089035 [Amylostereum chailletii]